MVIIYYSNQPHPWYLFRWPQVAISPQSSTRRHQVPFFSIPKVGSLVSWPSTSTSFNPSCHLSIGGKNIGGTGGTLELTLVKLLFGAVPWTVSKWDMTVTLTQSKPNTHFEATYHTTLTFWKGPVLISCLDLSELLSRWYHLNWYEFFKRWLHKRGELSPSNAIDIPRVSGNFSRILVQDLAAPISLPQPSSPGFGGRPFWGVWTMSLRSQRQKRSVMSFPRKSHGVQQMQKPFNKQ